MNTPLKTKLHKHSVIQRFICFFIGHKKVVPMLNEDFHCIYTRGCPRCGMPTFGGITWKHCPPPPNSTPEQIEEFNRWKENHYNEIRSSLNVV